MKYENNWRRKAVSAEEVIKNVKNGSRLFVHGAAATPIPLLEALSKKPNLENVTLYHLHTQGPTHFEEPEQKGRIFSVSFFAGPNVRRAIEEGRADFIPVFLSDIPGLFSSRQIPLDIAILQVSPPDRHGLCTLGTSIDAAKAASEHAGMILAEINEQMPRTHGNSFIPFEKIHAFTWTDRPLVATEMPAESQVDSKIGEFIAELIEDGSTLQVGIGGIPNAVLRRLGKKQNLGIHTEMFSDSVLDLVEAGVITNQLKGLHKGRISTSFVIGSQRLFDFVNDNPTVEFHTCDRTNDSSLIRLNDKMVAINSAIEVDLTGQVCADSMGHRIFSGIGGQMDFIQGAALSKGGKPIIALHSTAKGESISRIVAAPKTGAGITTTRGHVHWVVTEYGAINLHGLSLRERGAALISIAHPDFRSELKKELAQTRHFSLS